MSWLTFTSDYGLQDAFVGVCHGVIARTAPAVRVLDVTHGVRRHDLRHGALVLQQAVGYLPQAVHLAVVDPGVGTARHGIALKTPRGSFVGPDNGLLLWAAEELGGIEAAYQLTEERYWLSPVSATFHGRDIFAPVAARIANGLALSKVGDECAVDALVSLPRPLLILGHGEVRGEVLAVDRFGNIQLSARVQDVVAAGLDPAQSLELTMAEQSLGVRLVHTFAGVAPGCFALCEDATGYLAAVVNQGRASDLLAARTGDGFVLAHG